MAVIQATNISGREVAQFIGEQPFLCNVNGIDRSCYDLWQLCHSANLNVWARYSPLTRNGAKWSSPAYQANPINAVEQWNYYSPTGYNANLSHFADYTDEVLPPVSVGFPTELKQGVNNGYNFNMSFLHDSNYYIGYEDVFPLITYGELYPCVVIDDMAGNFIYVAETQIPDIDLTAYFTGKTELRLTYCLSSHQKALDAPNMGGIKFYSIRFNEDTAVTKVLPYKASTASGLILSVTSGYITNGSTVSFEKLNEMLIGLYCNVTDSNGNILPDDTLIADISEPNGNTQQVTLTRTSGSEYGNARVTFVSAFNPVKALNLTVYRNGKSESKTIPSKQSPII